jgi:hypothetical protein
MEGMLMNGRRLTAVIMLMMGMLVALSQPANAAATQLSGVSFYAPAGACAAPPAGYWNYTDYPPIQMTGSLDGCWYTKVDTSALKPSGVYLETGREVFVGSLDGGAEGMFATTYRFEGKFDAGGAETFGRCQHPIVSGSGSGAFEGVSGRVDFKDIVETGEFVYRGHLKF